MRSIFLTLSCLFLVSACGDEVPSPTGTTTARDDAQLVAAAAPAAAEADGTAQPVEPLLVNREQAKIIELADSGHALAQADRGLSLINGTHGTHDPERGMAMLKGAAEQGLLFAQFELARNYQWGTAGEPNPALAIQLLTKAADAGHLESARYLADGHRLGTLGPRDLKAAAALYERVLAADPSASAVGPDEIAIAAHLAQARRQQDLANLGMAWICLSLNDARAATFARRAADAGLSDGQNLLGFLLLHGRLTPRDTPAALAWMTKAADQGHAGAAVDLGFHFLRLHWADPSDPMNANAKQAATWLRVAAGQGNVTARFHLGLLYWNGHGRRRDAKAADRWFKLVLQAAEDGDPVSQGNMGYLYNTGLWVKQDLKLATQWFEKAAGQGSVYAQTSLGWQYANGSGVERNLSTAAGWYRKAADAGDARAQYLLAQLLESGSGVAKDPQAALALFRLAAAQGYRDAAAQVRRLESPLKEKTP